MNIKEVVNNKEVWSAILEEVGVHLEVQRRALEVHSEPVDLYKAQGQVKAFKRILALRDEVNGRK